MENSKHNFNWNEYRKFLEKNKKKFELEQQQGVKRKKVANIIYETLEEHNKKGIEYCFELNERKSYRRI